MQEGSFRCDANVSVRPKGETKFGTRTELKNINSFRFVERAINYEIERQIDVIESGGKIAQETRLYDPDKNETRPMRSKEEANDYRYFPDPDLLPLIITEELIEQVRSELPELPQQKRERFMEQYGLSAYDASILVSSETWRIIMKQSSKNPAISLNLAANWVIGELFGALNKAGFRNYMKAPFHAAQLGKLLHALPMTPFPAKSPKPFLKHYGIKKVMWMTSLKNAA